MVRLRVMVTNENGAGLRPRALAVLITPLGRIGLPNVRRER